MPTTKEHRNTDFAAQRTDKTLQNLTSSQDSENERGVHKTSLPSITRPMDSLDTATEIDPRDNNDRDSYYNRSNNSLDLMPTAYTTTTTCTKKTSRLQYNGEDESRTRKTCGTTRQQFLSLGLLIQNRKITEAAQIIEGLINSNFYHAAMISMLNTGLPLIMAARINNIPFTQFLLGQFREFLDESAQVKIIPPSCYEAIYHADNMGHTEIKRLLSEFFNEYEEHKPKYVEHLKHLKKTTLDCPTQRRLVRLMPLPLNSDNNNKRAR